MASGLEWWCFVIGKLVTLCLGSVSSSGWCNPLVIALGFWAWSLIMDCFTILFFHVFFYFLLSCY